MELTKQKWCQPVWPCSSGNVWLLNGSLLPLLPVFTNLAVHAAQPLQLLNTASCKLRLHVTSRRLELVQPQGLSYVLKVRFHGRSTALTGESDGVALPGYIASTKRQRSVKAVSNRLLQQLEHCLLAGVGLGQHSRGGLLHDLRA